jgi:hypothetical protein
MDGKHDSLIRGVFIVAMIALTVGPFLLFLKDIGGLPAFPKEAAMGFDLNALLAAFIGTFVGALVAFQLEHNARKQEKIEARTTEGNLALLTLFQMFNSLRQFQKEVIATAPHAPGRWLRMKVTFPQRDDDIGFDPARLAFLFEYDDKNLLPEVLMEEGRFKLAFDMINRRTHLMLERIHPTLSRAGLQHGQAVNDLILTQLLGPALVAEIDQLTESLVVNVNEDVKSLVDTFGKLRTALVRLLPGSKFIRVEFDMPPNN